MRYTARREQGGSFLRDERFSANGPLVFAFKDLESFVLPMMDVGWWTAASHVVRLDCADDPASVASVNANHHGDAEDVDFLAAFGRELEEIHGGYVLCSCADQQDNKDGDILCWQYTSRYSNVASQKSVSVLQRRKGSLQLNQL